MNDGCELVSSWKQLILSFLMLVGLIGWLGPTLYDMNPTADFEVEHLLLSTGQNRSMQATLYVPDGEGQSPAILFGAGSGADPALYTNGGKIFARHGFVVLMVGPGNQISDGGMPEWEMINDRETLLENQEEQFLLLLDYLNGLPEVDPERIIVGGHSGGANTAYRLAFEKRDISGVIAVAGRFPPENSQFLQNNLLLVTGSHDTIVPPDKIREVGLQLTGRYMEEGVLYGSFDNNTAKKIFISDGTGHLGEGFDEDIIKECLNFALRSVGKSQTNGPVNVVSLNSVLFCLMAGLLFLISFIALSNEYVKLRLHDNKFKNIMPGIYFILFYLVLSTTISKYLRFLGPVDYRIQQYLIIAAITIVVGIALSSIAENPGSSRRISLILDLILIGISIALFTLIYTQFVQFQLVTQMVLGIVITLLIFLPLLAMYSSGIPFKKRLIFNILSLIWLVPAITPVC
jgi:dienelactone hydrolase